MTDRQRTILAFVLMGLVLLLYMTYNRMVSPPPPTTQPVTPPAASRPADALPLPGTMPTRPATTEPVRPPVPLTRPADRRFEPAGLPPRDDIVLGWTDPDTPGDCRLQVRLTNQGAAVTRVTLADYRNRDQTGPLVLFGLDRNREVYRNDPSLLPKVWPPPADRLFLLNDYLETPPHRTLDLEDVTFEVVDQTDTRVVFQTLMLPERIRIRKVFEVLPAAYSLDVQVEITNEGEVARPFSYQLIAGGAMPREEVRIGRRAPPSELVAILVARRQNGAFRMRDAYTEKADDQAWNRLDRTERLAAAGLANKYFALVVMPLGPPNQDHIDFIRSEKVLEEHHYALLQADKKGANTRTQLSDRQLEEMAETARTSALIRLVTRGDQVLLPGAENRWTHHYRLFAGPKEPSALRVYAEHGLPQLFSYGVGIFNPIASILGALLHFFHGLPPYNYGIAIILLTIAVRAAMHPLTRKQARTMQGMQKLKPQLDELKKKFKGDRQALGQAQMALYKKHGYSPLSGCLPMLLQMPIFIALWRALNVDPSLRQAPFIPPITDLSQPDSLFPLGFSIPLIFNEITHVRLLPILSMAAMFVSQKLTPKPPAGNDQQASTQRNMMIFMFVFFAIMLYNVSSGLLLYITVSSVIGILEQWHIRKSVAALADAPAPVRAAPKTASRPVKSAARRRRR